METSFIENLALGFSVALSIKNLLFALIGALIGTAIGVLPGIGPVATISLLLPITFGQPATTAIIMLAGIYYGAQYGGSTTAILLNLPGEISSGMPNVNLACPLVGSVPTIASVTPASVMASALSTDP